MEEEFFEGGEENWNKGFLVIGKGLGKVETNAEITKLFNCQN